MSEENIYDAIIIGAGPSGIAAAYTMAKTGLKVCVLDRGDFAGAKNLFGGILFSTVLNKLIPNFWEEAPIERHITIRKFSFLTEDSLASLDLQSEKFNQPPFNNTFTVLRSKFDKWFAGKAEEVGAELYCGVVVDDFIRKEGKVIGIKARGQNKDEQDELYAQVVVCAEGANSMLAEKSGLRNKSQWMNKRNRVAAVKEIIALPPDIIADRFHLSGNEGAAYEYFGNAIKGMVGSAFIYTNKETISVGVGCTIESLVKKEIALYDLLDHFKSHPRVKNLIRGGEVLEYSTHMIPEDSFNNLPQLYANGLILVGDCAGLVNSSPHHEVTNMAMASGVFAAETIIEAKKQNNYSAETLSLYRKKLEDSFVFKDMNMFKDTVEFISENERILNTYPQFAVNALIDFFTVSSKSKKEIKKEIYKNFRAQIKLIPLLGDLLKAKGKMI